MISAVFKACAAAFSLMIIFVSPALAQGEVQEVHVAAYLATPFVIEDHGSLTGFSIDLWNAIATQLRVKTSYQIMSSASALEEAMRLKTADMIASPIVITLSRFKQYDFSLPVLQAGLQIMVRDTSETAKPAGALEDLLAMMFQLNSPLRRKVGGALLALRQNGTYEQFYDKWFGSPRGSLTRVSGMNEPSLLSNIVED